MDKFHPQSPGMFVKEGHEETDLSVRGIAVFLICLAVGLALTLVAAGAIVKGFEWAERKWFDPRLSPVEQELQKARGLTAESRMNEYPGQHGKEAGIKPSNEELERIKIENSLEKTFATPRLQYDDVNELDHFRESEDKYLDSTFKDENGNIHIPISRAIDLLAQRGLPAVNGTFSPTAPVAVPTGESRSSSHQEKSGRGLSGAIKP
jgi:hypothetical protein